MKLQSDHKPVERGGVVGESQFHIKSTAKAFSILSSSLYSDKILAIVRELSCNAYDAHVAAGKPTEPIEVKLPTDFDPLFYVKDNGIGLTHEQIAGYWKDDEDENGNPTKTFVPGIYQTFFDSNKTDSNEFIGALGLGSKTPFSYTNAFTVESRKDGVHRTYTAFINDEGVPAITLLGEEPTTESNGMKISIATKRDDVRRFFEAAQYAFMYFNPKPKVLGSKHFAPYHIKHTTGGDNWKIREADYYAQMNGAYVIQGLVAYPIDREILSRNGLSGYGKMILEQNIDLIVPLGAVEPQPSREGLSYTPTTIKNLMAIVNDAAAAMHDTYQKMFDALPSMWDAMQLHAQLQHYTHKGNDLYKQLIRQSPFKYKGADISGKVVLDLSKTKNTEVLVAQPDKTAYTVRLQKQGAWTPESVHTNFDFNISANMYVLVNDENVGRDRLSGWLQSVMDECSKRSVRENIRIVMIKGTSKKAYDKAEVADVVKQLGVPNPIYVSQLNLGSSGTKSSYKAKKLDQVMSWKGFPEDRNSRHGAKREVFSRLCWTQETINLTDGGFYVPVERFNAIDNVERDPYRLEKLVAFKLFDDKPIYGMNEKQVKAIANDPKWINAFEHANTIAPSLNANDGIYNEVKASQVFGNINPNLRDRVLRRWSHVNTFFVDGNFKTMMEELFAMTKTKRTDLDMNAIQRLANNLTPIRTIQQNANSDAEKVVRKYNVTIEGYEMLKLIDWSRVNGDNDIKMIADYVNTIDRV